MINKRDFLKSGATAIVASAGTTATLAAVRPSLDALAEIKRQVLWLSTAIVHHANRVRPNPGGLKVGGHQASSASMVSIMTSLWFRHLRADDGFWAAWKMAAITEPMIAAAVIGGTSLLGGRGSVWGALLGALVMASLDNGMSLLDTEAFWQPILKGSILVVAVAADLAARRRD